jgi:sterol desaturase/sphingolipid hydroxylase (fatty acid hydroxylase superfamily)
VVLFYPPIVWKATIPFGFRHGLSRHSCQFFIHTELLPRIGWLDWVLNTPSAHRARHASNPEHIDKNFGGVLLIWDHLFGTYQAERPDIKIRYGLIHPRSSDSNPFIIAYEEEMWNAPGCAGLRARHWRRPDPCHVTLIFIAGLASAAP